MSEPTFEQSRLRPFSVKQGDDGRQVVELAGQDISQHVQGVQIDMVANQPFADVLLTLSARAGMHPEIDTLARVVVAAESDIGPAVTRFLSALDPEALEQAALNRLDIQPGPQGGTKAMLAQLIEWANGES